MIRKLKNVRLFSNNLFSLLALALLISGCGKKIAVFSKTYNRDNLNIQELQYDYLTIKSKIKLQETHKTTNATAIVRLKKDSVIWFNLSGALGVQGMRGIITKDSVKVLNRVDKTYQVYGIGDIAGEFNFPIDFELIQSMVVGNMPKPRAKDDYVKMQNGKYVVRQNIGEILIDNYIDPDVMKLVEVDVVEKSTDNRLKLLYKDFRQINDQAFPFSAFISLIHHNEFGELETQLNIDHSKVEISETPLKFPFSVPKKYEVQ